MSNLLKRKLYIQAVSYGGDFTINLYATEMVTSSYCTAITLDTIEVEFEAPKQSQADFHAMKRAQLEQVKADIMRNAELQCIALGG